VTAIDLFDKNDFTAVNNIKTEWLGKVGGEVFIP
jgi:hypothetical protein